MNCRTASALISAYIDGELQRSQSLAVRAHIHDCADCAAEFDALQQLKRCMQNLPIREPESMLEDRVLRATVAAGAGPNVRVVPVLRHALAGLTVCAAIISAVLFNGAFLGPKTSQAADSVASSFDLERDQAFMAGADPLSGRAPIFTVSHAKR